MVSAGLQDLNDILPFLCIIIGAMLIVLAFILAILKDLQ